MILLTEHQVPIYTQNNVGEAVYYKGKIISITSV